MSLAALCVVGVFITFTGVVELGLGLKGGNATSASKSTQMGPWIWALQSVHIFGLGLVKLSAAFKLLPASNFRSHPYAHVIRGVLIIGLIFLVFWHTLEWFISILVYCIPLVAAWDLAYGEDARCMSSSESQHWAMANHSINAITSHLISLLAFSAAISYSFKIGVKLYLVVIAAMALFSCAISIVRSRMVATSWAQIGDRGKYDLSLMTWGAIELLIAMIAVNLGALLPLRRAFQTPSASEAPRAVPKISGPVAGSAVHVSHGDVDSIFSIDPTANNDKSQSRPNKRYSTQTIMYRPNTAYFPAGYDESGITRFHDDESNLDFDIESPSTRSKRKLTKPFPLSRFSGSTTFTHDTRRTSDWSQFSGFTYYSHNSLHDFGNTKENTGETVISATELDDISRSFGVWHEVDQREEIHVVSENDEEERQHRRFPTIFLEDDSKYVYSQRV
ncbi:hypothetical protein ACJQWK_01803 [Exserohilum turcicum]